MHRQLYFVQYYAEIEKLLNELGKTLHNFPIMPFPEASYLGNMKNLLIAEEVSYNVEKMKAEHDRLYSNLNMEQQKVYDSVITSVNSKKGGSFFVHGSVGCGKTFLWKTLFFCLRSEKK